MSVDGMKVVDLFSGCGGMSLGFKNAGYTIAAAFENWLAAINVYKANFDHPLFEQDLSRVDQNLLSMIEGYNPDIIIGGPPCQDFSSAGKRDESLGRADLTLSFATIVSELTPEWFVMENVQRISKSAILKEATALFQKSGYGLTPIVLDASYCGVPQARKRFFLIGHRYSQDDFLKPYLEKNLANTPLSVHGYLGDALGAQHYYRHPRSYKRRGIFSVHEPSPTIRGVNRPIPKGYKNHAGDTSSVNENLRPLTTLERSYIQTFPKDFIFTGTKTDLEQMIGNAVPVNLAKYVGQAIKEYCNDRVKRASSRKSYEAQLSFEHA